MDHPKNRYHGRNLAHDRLDDEDGIIRVVAGADPTALASAISNAFYGTNHVVLRAIGASAVNQAVKAVAISRGFVAPRGLDLICRPGFIDVDNDRRGGSERITALVFRLTLV